MKRFLKLSFVCILFSVVFFGCTNDEFEKLTETVTDIDGNVYHAIKIGDQVWLTENLRVTKYNDGTAIPNVTDSAAWANLTTDGYCYYDNDPAYGTTQGCLYNWYAVNIGKLAPEGWHVATDAEWTVLSEYLGGNSEAGAKLKSITGWDSPNTGATKSGSFMALSGGSRSSSGFKLRGQYGIWWSSTENDAGTAWDRYLYYNASSVQRNGSSKYLGASIRCVKNN